LSKRRNWSEEEVRHALALYLVTDFGRIHNKNPDIIALASQLGRTPNAIALKLANLAALDESLLRKGMGNVSATDRLIWNEFVQHPDAVIGAYEQRLSMDLLVGNKIPVLPQTEVHDLSGFTEAAAEFIHQEAGERQAITTQRIGQGFFRRMILTSYKERCALTGIEDTRLLNASHIVPWKDDAQNRVNPTNGICLNALHDRAFDRHLITFDEDYRMKIAPHVPSIARRELERVDSGRLEMPNRFLPNQVFLEVHRQEFFGKSNELR